MQLAAVIGWKMEVGKNIFTGFVQQGGGRPGRGPRHRCALFRQHSMTIKTRVSNRDHVRGNFILASDPESSHLHHSCGLPWGYGQERGTHTSCGQEPEPNSAAGLSHSRAILRWREGETLE
jgi:hypothetical protein